LTWEDLDLKKNENLRFVYMIYINFSIFKDLRFDLIFAHHYVTDLTLLVD